MEWFNRSNCGILMLILTGFTSYAGVWTECSPLSVPRWYPGCAELEGRIYIIGGQDSIPPFSSVADVEIYDTATDSWSAAAPMNHDRWGLMVAAVDGRIYAIGGQSGSFLDGYRATDYNEMYDPATDTWTELAPMPTARGWGGCAVWEDTIFAFGGYDPDVEDTGMEIEKYCPETDTWSSDPPMSIYRETFSCVELAGFIYLIGGWGSDMVQSYDPESKTWTDLSPMPNERGGSGAAVYEGCIVLVGGRGGAERAELYLPESDAWLPLEDLPTPREGLACAVVDGILYAITGSKPVSQGGLPYYGIVECLDLRLSGQPDCCGI